MTKNKKTSVKPSKNNHGLNRTKNEAAILTQSSQNFNHTPDTVFGLNDLVLDEGDQLLRKYGRQFTVSYGSSRKKSPQGYCYDNAVRQMLAGYGYVEGFVVPKGESIRIAHAWNVDAKGNHFDFTFKDADKYDYYGIKIPDMTVLKTGFANGCVSFAVLPFIKENDLAA
jgi:hypothetical protein